MNQAYPISICFEKRTFQLLLLTLRNNKFIKTKSSHTAPQHPPLYTVLGNEPEDACFVYPIRQAQSIA
jgi:hypothetical protein